MVIPFIMLISTVLLRFIPHKLIYPISIFLGNIWYIFSKRKKIIRKNILMIKNVYDESLVKKTFINFLFTYLILLKLPNMKKNAFLKLFPKDIEKIHLKDIRKNEGAILVSAHLGAWEIAGPLLASLGYKIISVAESKGPGERFFKFYLRYRKIFGAEILRLEEKDVINKLINFNKKGYLIGLISDRDISKTGKTIEFFNGKISLPTGPAILSYRLKAKILVGFILVKDGNFITLSYPIINPMDMSLNDIFKKIKDYIEDAVRKYPDNWFVFEDIWR